MKNFKLYFFTLLVLFVGSNYSNAQSISDILGKIGQSVKGDNNSSGISGTLGNILEGVFSSSNLTIADLSGNWLSSGPAVCFQGDDVLKKAGGIAAAAAIENKIDPYFKQYGLTGAQLSILEDGSFTLTIKKAKLKGTISQNESGEKGVFDFNFTALGKVKLGAVKTYVQKTSQSMDVMFDAKKLMQLVSVVSKISNIKTLSTLSSILNSYDGLCVGFKMWAQSSN